MKTRVFFVLIIDNEMFFKKLSFALIVSFIIYLIQDIVAYNVTSDNTTKNSANINNKSLNTLS